MKTLFLEPTNSLKQIELAGFATSVEKRSPAQRYNAEKAAKALNGKRVEPGAIFSFNNTVKSWSWDQGYVKAPVSFDGELIKAYGGGVCQTSTTLYNAVLLAGLEIVERHPHVFAPRYVPAGRDAAVAQSSIDMRFRNSLSTPITIYSEIKGDRIQIRLMGYEKPKMRPEIVGEMLSFSLPARMTREVSDVSANGRGRRTYIRNPGAKGYRVMTWRVFSQNGKEIRREFLGDDTYQSMDRLVHRVSN